MLTPIQTWPHQSPMQPNKLLWTNPTHSMEIGKNSKSFYNWWRSTWMLTIECTEATWSKLLSYCHSWTADQLLLGSTNSWMKSWNNHHLQTQTISLSSMQRMKIGSSIDKHICKIQAASSSCRNWPNHALTIELFKETLIPVLRTRMMNLEMPLTTGTPGPSGWTINITSQNGQ